MKKPTKTNYNNYQGRVYRLLNFLVDGYKSDLHEEVADVFQDWIISYGRFTNTDMNFICLEDTVDAIVSGICPFMRVSTAKDWKGFDKLCDDLMDWDFFGTEGQNDPRGDWRG